jgi:hypothetical protein
MTLYLVDQYGQRRAWATGTTRGDAEALLRTDAEEYKRNRPDLRLRVVAEAEAAR